MDTEIIVALIGAAAVIIAALIGLLGKCRDTAKTRSATKNSIKIKQTSKGANATQIGYVATTEKGWEKDV